MKLTEAIKTMQMQLAEHGDLEIVSITDIDGGFIVDMGRVFEVIEMPNDDETEMIKVSAFVEPTEEETVPAFKVLR